MCWHLYVLTPNVYGFSRQQSQICGQTSSQNRRNAVHWSMFIALYSDCSWSKTTGTKDKGMTCNASILHHKSRKLDSNGILKVNMWKRIPTRIRSSKDSNSQLISESNVILKSKKISTSKNLRKERTCGRGPNTNSSIWHAVSRSRVFCRGSKRKRKHWLVWGSTETCMPREILYWSKSST